MGVVSPAFLGPRKDTPVGECHSFSKYLENTWDEASGCRLAGAGGGFPDS
jgi:hypothetical protein